MATPSTDYSPGSSEGDSTDIMDQRKRKRMESNRESARRSRMRKQKRLDDLNSQFALFRKENDRILAGITVANQHYLNVEAENSILRAQVMELSHRFESLNQIIDSICCVPAAPEGFEMASFGSGHGFTNIDPFGPACTSFPITAAPAEAMLRY